MRKEPKVAVLLALGGLAAMGGTPSMAANTNPCSGNDVLITTVDGTYEDSFDLNGNNQVCQGQERQVAPKKKGGGFVTVYYDDRV